MTISKKNEQLLLESVLVACDLNLSRLQLAMKKISAWMPATATKLSDLSDDIIGFLDLFSTRFSKLQDLMGNKLFPLVLTITKDPGNYSTFIDLVRRLEKIGALPSATQWFRLREIRNAFMHDYPEESEQRAHAINEAYQHAGELIIIYKNLCQFIKQY
jgi:hypothetical protein